MVSFHEDILIEILSILSVKSILRFKSVCKSWYDLLSLPHFVSKHLAIQYQSGEKLMLLKRDIYIPSDSDDYDYFYHGGMTGSIDREMCIVSKNNMHDPESFDLSVFRGFGQYGLHLIGHCDGLIAVSNYELSIIVCNPATGDFRILPNSCIYPPPIAYDASIVNPDQKGTIRLIDYGKILGFGYDRTKKDHKIVRIVTFSWFESGVKKFMHKAEVFCIGASCWRELNIIIDFTLPSLEDYKIREPYFDGIYYWWARDVETGQHVLTSFHMADELFRTTPLPMAMQEIFEDHMEVSIGVYNDSIALYIHRGGVPDCVEIWAMNEIGVNVSWSKQLTVPFIGPSQFVGFWNGSDKEYFYVDDNGELALYNCDTTESKTVPLQGMPESWQVVPYMRTIVSVQSKALFLCLN